MSARLLASASSLVERVWSSAFGSDSFDDARCRTQFLQSSSSADSSHSLSGVSLLLQSLYAHRHYERACMDILVSEGLMSTAKYNRSIPV